MKESEKAVMRLTCFFIEVVRDYSRFHFQGKYIRNIYPVIQSRKVMTLCLPFIIVAIGSDSLWLSSGFHLNKHNFKYILEFIVIQCKELQYS